MDFAVDETLLLEAKEKCETAATDITGYIDNIYKLIRETLYTHWEGDSYNEFRDTCNSYENSLRQLPVILNAYAKLLDNVNTPRETLEETIKSALGTK